MSDLVDGSSFVVCASKLASVLRSQRTSNSSPPGTNRIKARLYTSFFVAPTNPVTVGALRKLSQRALSIVQEASPSLGLMLQLLLQIIFPPKSSRSDSECIQSVHEALLFVVLRTSISTSSCCAVLRPRCSISMRLTSVIERRNRHELLEASCSWSAHLDPVVAATTMTSSGTTDIDEASFISDSSGEESFLRSLINRSVQLSSASWDASDIVILDQAKNETHQQKIRDDDYEVARSVTNCSRPSFGLPFRDRFIESNDFKNGMLYVAMHRAILGLPDPFNIVVLAEDHPIPTVQLRDPFVYRPELSLVKWCCEKGCALLRLQLVIKLAESSWQKGPLGRYGCAAVCALREQLNVVKKQVSIYSELIGGPQAVRFSVLMSSFLRLRDVGATLDLMCDIYNVTLDGQWVPRDSVLACNVSLISALNDRRVTILRQQQSSNLEVKITSLFEPAAVISRMLTRMTGALNGFVSVWLQQSTVDDPFDEFFIIPSFGANACGFSIAADRLPSFISIEAAEDVLQAGVSRALAALLIGSMEDHDERRLHMLRLACPDFCPMNQDWATFFANSEQSPMGNVVDGETAHIEPAETFCSTPEAEFGSQSAPYLTSEQRHSVTNADTGSPQYESSLQDDTIAREAAAAYLHQQHELRMRIETYNEHLLAWKSKRIALTRVRRLAIERVVEEVGFMQQSLTSDPTRVTPVRQLVIPLNSSTQVDNTTEEGAMPLHSNVAEVSPSVDEASSVVPLVLGSIEAEDYPVEARVFVPMDSECEQAASNVPMIAADEEADLAILPYDARRSRAHQEENKAVITSKEEVFVLFPPEDDETVERFDHVAFVNSFREKCLAEQCIDISSEDYYNRCVEKAQTSTWHDHPDCGADGQLLEVESVVVLPQNLSDTYKFGARLARTYFTKRALMIALYDANGIIGNTARLLIDVMLLQDEVASSLMLDTWQAAVFQPVIDFNSAFVSMHVSFAANWVLSARKYSVPTTFLSLRLSKRASAQAQHLGNVTDILTMISFVEETVPGQGFWLFPNETITRYSDILVALTYWRWLEHLVSQVWRAAMKRKIPQSFLFVSFARVVFSQAACIIWSNLKNIVGEYKRTCLDTEMSSCGDEKVPKSVEWFTVCHENFLMQCMRVTLLSPEFGRARRTLRTLARQTETVFHLLSSGTTDDPRESISELMFKKIKEFVVTAELFAHQLEEVNDDFCKPIIEGIKFSISGFTS